MTSEPRPRCDRCFEGEASGEPVPDVFAYLYKQVCETCRKRLLVMNKEVHLALLARATGGSRGV